MNMDNNKGRLVIADKDYLPFLFEHLGKDRNKQITIWSIDDLFNHVADEISSNAVPYLRKQGISYQKANDYLDLLIHSDYRKNEKLKKRHDELQQQGRIREKPFGKARISSYQVYLFERQEDLVVHGFLQRLNIPFKDLDIESFHLENRYTLLNHPKTILFSDKFHQFRYVFSDIRKRILEDKTGKRKSDILIHVKGDEDVFYLSGIGNLFSIPVIKETSSSFLAEEGVKDKLDSIYKTKDFSFTEEERVKPNRKSLNQRIEKYSLKEVEEKQGFSFAFSCLLEIISSYKRKGFTSKRGVRASDKFLFRPGQIVYVTDFLFGRFYLESKDNNVLTDDELVEISFNPSYVTTNLDRRKKKNYLSYRNIVLLSRVKQHLNDNLFSSQFFNERKEEEKKYKKAHKDALLPQLCETTDYNKEGVYTSESRKAYLARQRDSQFRFGKYRLNTKEGESIVFNGYDHSFKGLKENIFPLPETFSVTNLESYILCPFKYYREARIPDQIQDYFSRFRGTRIHSVFETINHKDYSFDEAFERGKKSLREDREKRGQKFDKQRERTRENIKEWLKPIAGEVRKRVKENISLRVNDNDAERKIEFTLSDHGKTYPFSGYIDKRIFSEREGRHFYTIVDYKTGAESFIPKETYFGRSIQLPLYAYAIEQKKEEAVAKKQDSIPYRPNLKATFGGFAIEHIYDKSPKGRFALSKKKEKTRTEADLSTKVKLEGLVLEDEDYLKSRTKFFDTEGTRTDAIQYKNKKGDIRFNQSLMFAPVATFAKDEKEADPTLRKDRTNRKISRKQVRQDSVNSALSIIHHLEKGEFPIQPTSSPLTSFTTDNLICRLCNYKDVCFHKINDALDYKKKIDNVETERKKRKKKKENKEGKGEKKNG